MSPSPAPPFDDGAGPLLDHLWRRHGSHERPGVLYRWYSEDLVDGRTLAALLPEVWTMRNEKMGDTIAPDEWDELFGATDIDPATWYAGLELPTTIYRAGHADGMSWTTDQAVADRFAERGTEVQALELTSLLDVLAVFHDRNESRGGASTRPSATR
jgi:hypothetical protein